MDKLRVCYDRLKEILGSDVEPYESVELVERYRNYWRPDSGKAKIILLAESHVFTRDNDRNFKLPPMSRLPGYPTAYAKFVYCLAYGESWLINGVNRPKDVGTFQFWQLFYGCDHRISAAGDFAPVLKTYTKDSERRINNKIDLLLSLKKKGIWLVDSSIVALYDNEKRPRKPNADTIESAIRASWEGYTRDVIKDAQPEHIICVGKGIHKVLGHDIETLVRKNRVISQPNTRPNKRGPSPLDNLKECSAVCCQVCRVG